VIKTLDGQKFYGENNCIEAEKVGYCIREKNNCKTGTNYHL